MKFSTPQQAIDQLIALVTKMYDAETARAWFDEMKDWVDTSGEDEKILSYIVDQKRENIIVVTECIQHDETNRSTPALFSVYRFFSGAGKWHTSVDLQNKELHVLADLLLYINSSQKVGE
jgi:hypothetical protein